MHMLAYSNQRYHGEPIKYATARCPDAIKYAMARLPRGSDAIKYVMARLPRCNDWLHPASSGISDRHHHTGFQIARSRRRRLLGQKTNGQGRPAAAVRRQTASSGDGEVMKVAARGLFGGGGGASGVASRRPGRLRATGYALFS